jgi:hypothetical protein
MIGPSLENLWAQSFTCIAALFLVERFHVCMWESGQLYMVSALKPKCLLVDVSCTNPKRRVVTMYSMSNVNFPSAGKMCPSQKCVSSELAGNEHEKWRDMANWWTSVTHKNIQEVRRDTSGDEHWVWLGTKMTCLAQFITVLGHIQIESFSGVFCLTNRNLGVLSGLPMKNQPVR